MASFKIEKIDIPYDDDSRPVSAVISVDGGVGSLLKTQRGTVRVATLGSSAEGVYSGHKTCSFEIRREGDKLRITSEDLAPQKWGANGFDGSPAACFESVKNVPDVVEKIVKWFINDSEKS